jgi:hypothetical protein
MPTCVTENSKPLLAAFDLINPSVPPVADVISELSNCY